MEKCHHVICEQRRSRSACISVELEHSLFIDIYTTVSIDSVSGQRMLWSACANRRMDHVRALRMIWQIKFTSRDCINKIKSNQIVYFTILLLLFFPYHYERFMNTFYCTESDFCFYILEVSLVLSMLKSDISRKRKPLLKELLLKKKIRKPNNWIKDEYSDHCGFTHIKRLSK